MPAAEASIMIVHDATRRFIVYGGFGIDTTISNRFSTFITNPQANGFPFVCTTWAESVKQLRMDVRENTNG